MNAADPVKRWFSRAIAGALLAATGTVATQVRAQAADRSADVATTRGSISGSTRYVGMGGAFVAIADDTEGVAINPASVALRLPYSWSDFDYGLGIDVGIGAWLPKNDIYNQGNSGGTAKSSALFGSLAAVLYYRYAGLGIAAEAEQNAATNADTTQGIGRNLAANFGMVHTAVAYGFWKGQLLLGAGPRIVGMSFDRSRQGSSPLSTAGIGYEAGFTVKPTIAQYRLAAAIRSPVRASVAGAPGDPISHVHVPWEASLGFAYQFGTRPLNPPFVSSTDLARATNGTSKPTHAELERAEHELFERYEGLQRWYLLVTAELSLIQGSGNLGIGGRESDVNAIVSPRVGVESEVIPHHLRLRAGSYYEPPLAEGVSGRVHGCGGFDVRLFEWNVFGLVHPFDYWQLSLGADASRQYLNTMASIGFWH